LPGPGWLKSRNRQAKKGTIHHGGDLIGGRAFLMAYPEGRVVVAVVSNLSFAKIGEKKSDRIADLFVS
jgi:Beta-lactamase